jgi:hypothetical protein
MMAERFSRGFMKPVYVIISAILAISAGVGIASAAQKVVLVTGDVMMVDRARVEGDRVWISWSGMTLSIDKKDVLRIEGNGKRDIIVRGASGKSRPQRQQTEKTGPDRNHSALQPNEPVKASAKNRGQSAGASGRPPLKSKPDQPRTSPPTGHRLESAEKFEALLVADGFGDLKWGDPLDPGAGFRRLDEDGELPEVDEYFRKDDPVHLGQDDRHRVVKYAFWRNHLYMVTLWVEGAEAYATMRAAMVNRYGPGIQSPEKKLTYYWVDETADRMIDYLEDRGLGMLWMRSREINHRYKLSRLRIPINAGQSARSKSSEAPPQTKN